MGIACKSNYICCHNVDNVQGRITMPAVLHLVLISFFVPSALWPLPPFDQHSALRLAVLLSLGSRITLLSKLAAKKALLL